MGANAYNTRGALAQYRSVYFNNVHRVTLLPVIFGCSSIEDQTFVGRGASVAYRILKLDGMERVECLADCLPPRTRLNTWKELSGVDKSIFQQ